jgi:hypothetical protein
MDGEWQIVEFRGQYEIHGEDSGRCIAAEMTYDDALLVCESVNEYLGGLPISQTIVTDPTAFMFTPPPCARDHKCVPSRKACSGCGVGAMRRDAS